jgi:hypothetical protein
MGVVYPTTQVQDGMPKPQIPICVQRLSGLWYCYDDQGNLVYISNNYPPSPPISSIIDYPRIYTSYISSNTNLFLGSTGRFVFTPSHVAGIPFFGFLGYSGSVSVPVGTSNTYGSAVTIYNNQANGGIYGSQYALTLPVYITVTWGGTFASGETVTVELTFNIFNFSNDSSSSASTTLSATATGSQSLNFNNIIAVIVSAITTQTNIYNASNMYTVGSVTAAAASSASSTSVTVSVQAWFLTS